MSKPFFRELFIDENLKRSEDSKYRSKSLALLHRHGLAQGVLKKLATEAEVSN